MWDQLCWCLLIAFMGWEGLISFSSSDNKKKVKCVPNSHTHWSHSFIKCVVGGVLIPLITWCAGCMLPFIVSTSLNYIVRPAIRVWKQPHNLHDIISPGFEIFTHYPRHCWIFHFKGLPLWGEKAYFLGPLISFPILFLCPHHLSRVTVGMISSPQRYFSIIQCTRDEFRSLY